MTITQQIDAYIATQPEPKRRDLEALHTHILTVMPGAKLWFLDGKDESGRTVTNPNIGYGTRQMSYADGTTREFYQIGISANTSGISVYVLGIDDRTYLPDTYGKSIGKASVTGYCIKFKKLADIDLAVLDSAMRDGIRMTTP